MTMIMKNEKSKCILCRLPCTIVPVEMLPRAGILMKAIHEDGTTHTWREYNSIAEAAKQPRQKSNPRIITCPNCGKKGRINHYREDRVRHPEKIGYIVTHEYLPGMWGQGRSKIRRRRRCYIKDIVQREIVLKKLGRYIENGTGQLTLSDFSTTAK